MAILLYDLTGAEDRRFSPFCWRVRFALAHKGLAFTTRPTRFTEIKDVCGGGRSTLPIIEDGARVVCDSAVIADYLEETYPEAPSLYGGAAGRALTGFVANWVSAELGPRLFPMVVKDICDHLTPEDRPYFRESREKRLGRTLEEVQDGRETKLEGFRRALAPLRATVAGQAFLGGDSPLFADYVAAGHFQWARAVSPFALIADDDPVAQWLARVCGLFGGVGHGTPMYA